MPDQSQGFTGVLECGKKPCTGKQYARFDEGEQAAVTMVRLLRHRQKRGAETDRRTCEIQKYGETTIGEDKIGVGKQKR